MSKTIQIIVEQAKELLTTTPSLKDVIYSNFPELKPSVIPESWTSLKRISGYYIESNSEINTSFIVNATNTNKNVFKTKNQALAFGIVAAQLS